MHSQHLAAIKSTNTQYKASQILYLLLKTSQLYNFITKMYWKKQKQKKAPEFSKFIDSFMHVQKSPVLSTLLVEKNN